jgi:hypothetical protein
MNLGAVWMEENVAWKVSDFCQARQVRKMLFGLEVCA